MTVRKTSRRAVLAGMAAAPAAGLPALASPEDPIFAAIERHRVAWAAFRKANDLADQVARLRKGESVSAEDEALFNAATAAWSEAEDDLVETVPTTIAGARAAMEYILDYEEEEVDDTRGRFLPALLASPIFAP